MSRLKRAATSGLALAAVAVLAATTAAPRLRAASAAVAAENEKLLRQLAEIHGLSDEQLAEVKAVFGRARYISQGNPAVAVHPATPEECRSKLAAAGVSYEDDRFRAICGAPFMAPLYDPASERPEDARACIDQFEFPDLPCAYPLVWVRAREAAEICRAIGKRLCDAHEWEGACAGRLGPPDYRFDLARGQSASAAVSRMRSAHNQAHGPSKAWAYGPEFRRGVCAAASFKSAGCEGGGWDRCGSNTYPTGMFPECKSALGVYDLHGNAAEHMNLPLDESQMASRGSAELGVTEMKGSWFIWDSYRAHEDWCRWRAPYWHGSRVMDTASHHNYHLGFRCCKTLSGTPSP